MISMIISFFFAVTVFITVLSIAVFSVPLQTLRAFVSSADMYAVSALFIPILLSVHHILREEYGDDSEEGCEDERR